MAIYTALIALSLCALRRALETAIKTSCADGYSESRFASLRPGMSPWEVEIAGGSPIAKTPWRPNTENWQYSGKAGPVFYRGGWVIFTAGRVSEIVREITGIVGGFEGG